jgi:hypothetical protein
VIAFGFRDLFPRLEPGVETNQARPASFREIDARWMDVTPAPFGVASDFSEKWIPLFGLML